MILILGALEEEINELVRLADISVTNHWGPFSIYLGTINGKNACIVKCGVGKVLAAMLTQYLIDKYSPEELIFTGLAGALNPTYKIGDIILGTECVQHDMDASDLGFKRGQIPYTDIFALPCDQRLLHKARNYQINDFSIHTGRILTGDQFISKSGEVSHHYLTSELHGDAVDMESASVATVASINNLPFLIIRTLSDKANGESPADFQEFLPLASRHSAQLINFLLSD